MIESRHRVEGCLLFWGMAPSRCDIHHIGVLGGEPGSSGSTADRAMPLA
jgi:hypothetical protein